MPVATSLIPRGLPRLLSGALLLGCLPAAKPPLPPPLPLQVHLVRQSLPGRLPGAFWDPGEALNRPQPPSLSLRPLDTPAGPRRLPRELAASCRF